MNRKLKFVAALGIMFTLAWGTSAEAQLAVPALGPGGNPGNGETEERAFTVSATVPKATGVIISASKITPQEGGEPVWEPVPGDDLDFGNLSPMEGKEDTFAPDHYFAIDVAAVGGAGSPDVTFTYTEGTNPNNPDKGLGWKSTATFFRVEGPDGEQIEFPLDNHGPKKMLKDLTGEQIDDTETQGGFLRAYIGIVTKNEEQTYPDPDDSEPFTIGDAPGTYDGTLVVSGTVS